jgi:hypothetical protein
MRFHDRLLLTDPPPQFSFNLMDGVRCVWMLWKSIMKYKVPLHSGRHASCVRKQSLPGLAWSWWSPESRVQTPDKHSYHWSKLIEGKLLRYIVLKDYWGPIAGEGVCLSFDKLLRNWCKGLGICWKKEPNFLPDAKIIGVQLAKRIGSPLHVLRPSRGIQKMTKT